MKRANDQQDLLRHVETRISECRDVLAARNIRAELNVPVQEGEQVPEIAIYFWRDKQVLDVIEFSLSIETPLGMSDAGVTSWFDHEWNAAISKMTRD